MHKKQKFFIQNLSVVIKIVSQSYEEREKKLKNQKENNEFRK
jgi:hypothetical protein